MRLICPNCGAQYEVDDQVVPAQGRDVQCSNCGHTWFQRPADQDPELAEELGESYADEADDALEHVEDTVEDAVEGAVEDAGAAAADAGLKRRALDPEVTNVLREEASREAEARARDLADGDALETQPDLGLDTGSDEAAERSAAARARMARLRGQEDGGPEAEAALAAAAAAGSRSDLLPDIEEINSSLRASQDREELADPDFDAEDALTIEQAERRGFRFGFWIIVLLVALAVLLYVLAPQIITWVPQLESVMIAYVSWANSLREMLNSGIQVVLDWISGLVGSDTNPG